MAYEASIVADSISRQGHRLTTMLLKYPRFCHSEHLRHRSFSYSVASSRALPIEKMIEQVMMDPVLPVWWGKNQKGMQAKEELTGRQRDKAERLLLVGRDRAVEVAKWLADLGTVPYADSEDIGVGLHKQIVNRLLEPWMWVTVCVTGTEWENFFFLRCHPDAQPEIQKIAVMAEELYRTNVPSVLPAGSWHLPFIREEDWNDAEQLACKDEIVGVTTVSMHYENLKAMVEMLKQVSVGRVARTSYLTHLGTRDLMLDVALAETLLAGAKLDPPGPMHLSPFEHVARPLGEYEYIYQERNHVLNKALYEHELAAGRPLAAHLNTYGNLVGWRSMRSLIPGEAGPIRREKLDVNPTDLPGVLS